MVRVRGRVRVRVRIRVRVKVRVKVRVRVSVPHLIARDAVAHISPTSPLHLPYVSHTLLREMRWHSRRKPDCGEKRKRA